jgi:hypothetical protein
MADVSVKELPTADESPEDWNVIWIANQQCPGVCLPLEGERRRAVEHKKTKGSSRDILVDQGMDPTEVTIRIKTWDGATFRSLYDFYLKYMDPDRSLSRQNVVPVAHPQLYARGIKLGYFFSAPLPKPTQDTGIRPYIHEFRMKIVGPKTQIQGSSLDSSTKPKLAAQAAPGAPPSKWQINYATVNAVSSIVVTSLGTPIPTFPNSATPPAGQPLTLFDPLQQQQLASGGNTTARFSTDLLDKASPR